LNQLLSLMIGFFPRRHLPHALIACIVAAPLVRIGLWLTLPSDTLSRDALLPCRMDALFAGVLTAWMIRSYANWLSCTPLFRTIFTASIIGMAGLALIGDCDARSDIMGTVGYSVSAAFFTCILILVYERGTGVLSLHTLHQLGIW
jgi:hypothetical protein